MRGAALGVALLALLALGCASLEPMGRKGLVTLPSHEEPPERVGRRFALLVGIARFDDDRFPALRFAAKDARDMGAVLSAPERGRFDRAEVIVEPARTTRAALVSAIERLAEQATRPEDVVVVYVSSHGTLARDEQGELTRYLVASDTDYRRISETGLSMNELEAAFESIPSRRRLLILATCHSGGGKSLLPVEVLVELEGRKGAPLPPLASVSRSSMVFSASDWGEDAREDERLQNDIYTHFLLEALDGRADRNLDGAVSATEAHDHARRRTYEFSKGRQRPSARILEVGADPLVLSGIRDGVPHPELYSYDPRLEGFSVRVDGDPAVELPGGARVSTGGRTVELLKGGQVFAQRRVEVLPGQRIALDALLWPDPLKRSVFLFGGGLTFVDRSSRRELLGPSWISGLGLRWSDLPLSGLSLWTELGGALGQQRAILETGESFPFTYRLMSAATSIGWGVALGPLRIETGPRLSALWLGRTFELPTYNGNQDYLTLTPGWMAAATLRLGERLELVVRGHVMLTYVLVDGQGHALGFTGGAAAMGYRF